jgi:hypothetical protein
MAKIFLGCPLYDFRLFAAAARGFYAYASRRHEVGADDPNGTVLPLNCNTLWAEALNRHEREGTEWFAMLHSDVAAEPGWLDTLVDEANRLSADVLSVVVPIKDRRGSTSTAIAHPQDDCRTFCRLTLSQVKHPAFPVTFDLEAACNALKSLPPPGNF